MLGKYSSLILGQQAIIHFTVHTILQSIYMPYISTVQVSDKQIIVLLFTSNLKMY